MDRKLRLGAIVLAGMVAGANGLATAENSKGCVKHLDCYRWDQVPLVTTVSTDPSTHFTIWATGFQTAYMDELGLPPHAVGVYADDA